MQLIKTQKFAGQLAKQAGALLLRKFGKSKIVVKKGTNDFALDADLASERLILRELKQFSPEIPVLAEESNRPIDWRNGWCWIVDPLDGTKNYHFKIPFWCVSIALMHDGKPQVGVVYAPVTGELFSARLGGGAHSNGKKIQVSKTAKIAESLVVCEIPRRHSSQRSFTRDLRSFDHTLGKVRRVRAFAAAAHDLCLVAKGAADGYLDFSHSTKVWDIAAGQLIVSEAGGKISDTTPPKAPPNTASALATNAKLHLQFQRLFQT